MFSLLLLYILSTCGPTKTLLGMITMYPVLDLGSDVPNNQQTLTLEIGRVRMTGRSEVWPTLGSSTTQPRSLSSTLTTLLHVHGVDCHQKTETLQEGIRLDGKYEKSEKR